MVDTSAWTDQIDHFVAVRKIRAQTRELYRYQLGVFVRWCATTSNAPQELKPSQISQYLDYLRAIPLGRATVEGHLGTLRLFYRFLKAEGIVALDPTLDIQSDVISFETRDTLSVEQLRRVWDTADSHRKRVVIGLLGICGLKPGELSDAQIRDLSTIEGHNVLRVSSRNKRYSYAYVALPDEVFSEIISLVGDRRAGYLVQRKDLERLDRRTMYRIVVMAGKKADIPFNVVPLTLSYSLRAIAIEKGFSYVSVARTVAELDARKLAKWLAVAPESVGTHAPLRLARLVLGDRNETGKHLSHAVLMLQEGDAHAAAALGFAGAILERHLRSLASERGIRVEKDNPTLSTYSTYLRGGRVIEPVDVQKIAQVQSLRNTAAHGWFEQISIADALSAIRISEEIAQRYPLSPGSPNVQI
jgi:site-specific recombinase XerD